MAMRKQQQALRLGSLAAACLLLASLHGEPCQNVRAGLLDAWRQWADRSLDGTLLHLSQLEHHMAYQSRRPAGIRPSRFQHVDLRQPKARGWELLGFGLVLDADHHTTE